MDSSVMGLGPWRGVAGTLYLEAGPSLCEKLWPLLVVSLVCCNLLWRFRWLDVLLLVM